VNSERDMIVPVNVNYKWIIIRFKHLATVGGLLCPLML